MSFYAIRNRWLSIHYRYYIGLTHREEVMKLNCQKKVMEISEKEGLIPPPPLENMFSLRLISKRCKRNEQETNYTQKVY